jgi:hypothetical protein
MVPIRPEPRPGGALWDLRYEEVHKCQFKKGSSKASAEAVGRIEREAARLNRQIEIRCESSQRDETLAAISRERERARAWPPAQTSGGCAEDRSFLRDDHWHFRTSGHVESILALARTMNTSVVAEGAETDVQARELDG